MTWAFRSAASAINSSYVEDNIVISKPAGTVEGDLMKAAITYDSETVATPPTGWTLIRASDSEGTTRITRYFKIAGASEPSTYTWTMTGNTDITGGICSYSGVDQTAPLDVENAQYNNTEVTDVTAPSVTVTNADSLLTFDGCTDEDNTASTYTPPSGMLERVDIFNTWSSLIMADENVAAGATGTRVAVVTNAQESWGGLSAFKQAAAVVAVGQVTETNLAQGVSIRKTRSLGQVLESNLAQAVAKLKAKSLAQSAEVDLAQALATAKALQFGQATEADLSQTIVVGGGIVALLQATELDLAQSFTVSKVKALGQTAEVDSSQAISSLKTILLNNALEIDLSAALGRAKNRLFGQATEVDVASLLSPSFITEVLNLVLEDALFAKLLNESALFAKQRDEQTLFAKQLDVDAKF